MVDADLPISPSDTDIPFNPTMPVSAPRFRKLRETLQMDGAVTWAGLAGQVQNWVNNPSTNDGWILIGQEDLASSSTSVQAPRCILFGE